MLRKLILREFLSIGRFRPIGKRAKAKQSRRRAYSFGRRAEVAALLLLYCKGYRILARRYLAPGGEIDLVAARGKTIAFVEVKGRPAIGLARLAITEEKRRRISRAAAHWIGRHSGSMAANFRGDAIFVAPLGWPRHVAGAFELDL